jgi:hypothetical protein
MQVAVAVAAFRVFRSALAVLVAVVLVRKIMLLPDSRARTVWAAAAAVHGQAQRQAVTAAPV